MLAVTASPPQCPKVIIVILLILINILILVLVLTFTCTLSKQHIKAARVLYSTPILSYLIETVRFYSTLFYITLLYTVLNH